MQCYPGIMCAEARRLQFVCTCAGRDAFIGRSGGEGSRCTAAETGFKRLFACLRPLWVPTSVLHRRQALCVELKSCFLEWVIHRCSSLFSPPCSLIFEILSNVIGFCPVCGETCVPGGVCYSRNYRKGSLECFRRCFHVRLQPDFIHM